MGERERPPTVRALDALVAEAKDHLTVHDAANELPGASDGGGARIDFARLETRVMAAIEDEKGTLARAGEAARSRRRAVLVGVGLIAAAAVVVVLLRDGRDVVRGPVRIAASSLRSTEGAGGVLVDGVAAEPGQAVHAGSTIEVDGARAVFERPRKVTWMIEQDGSPAALEGSRAARARVVSAGEPLVLALDHGVIEADVVPVAVGEAFAIDVAAGRSVVRVAVHGTHLRVARAGDRVVVDLTEGVVSIGARPRSGLTHGTLVTAPAHVELDATDLQTLRVDDASVRDAVELGGHATNPPSEREPTEPTPAPPAADASTIEEAPASVPKKPAARAVIAAGVRACVARGVRPGAVRVTLSSELRLRVLPTGAVASARFFPPLSPDIQSCAAKIIYETKLDETGLVTIPIELSY